jgi:predicted transcriptional regulator
MKAREIMTLNPCSCSPNDSVQDVAQLMRDNDCGSVPVVDSDGCVVGTVTDRDLAVRGLAAGKGPDTRIANVMTLDPCCCGMDDDLSVVAQTMADNQVRRVPIVDDSGSLIGIIAQADLARAAETRKVSEHEVAIVVEKISEPISPYRSGTAGEQEQRF